ncbi:hypothetical protein EX30DRAFT_342491, partial [Ascodesmis nigricans]
MLAVFVCALCCVLCCAPCCVVLCCVCRRFWGWSCVVCGDVRDVGGWGMIGYSLDMM